MEWGGRGRSAFTKAREIQSARPGNVSAPVTISGFFHVFPGFSELKLPLRFPAFSAFFRDFPN